MDQNKINALLSLFAAATLLGIALSWLNMKAGSRPLKMTSCYAFVACYVFAGYVLTQLAAEVLTS